MQKAEERNQMTPEPSEQEIIVQQSRTITELCLAIDPTCTHGPETEKLCAYARQCREFFENSSLAEVLRRVENLEQLTRLESQMDGPAPICPICACRHLPHCKSEHL